VQVGWIMNLGSALDTVFIGKHSYALPHEDHTILKTRGIYTKKYYPGYKYNYVYPGAARGMNCSHRSARQKNQGQAPVTWLAWHGLFSTGSRGTSLCREPGDGLY
jgi:hypothetical protein